MAEFTARSFVLSVLSILLTVIASKSSHAQLPEHLDERWQTVKTKSDPLYARTGSIKLGLDGHPDQMTAAADVDVLKLKASVDGFDWWLVSCKMRHTRPESKIFSVPFQYNGPYLGTAEKNTVVKAGPNVWELTATVHTENGYIRTAGPGTTEGESNYSMSFGASISQDPSVSVEHSHTWNLTDRHITLFEHHGRLVEWHLDMPNKNAAVLDASSWRADLLVQIPAGSELDLQLNPVFKWRAQQVTLLGIDNSNPLVIGQTPNIPLPNHLYSHRLPIRVRATASGKSIIDSQGEWKRKFDRKRVSFKNGMEFREDIEPENVSFRWKPTSSTTPLDRTLILKFPNGEEYELSPVSVAGNNAAELNQYQNDGRTFVVDFESSSKAYWKSNERGVYGGVLTRNLD